MYKRSIDDPNGFWGEMGKRIKEDPATASAKVVVMTALYTGVKYEHEAYKSFKVDDYLSKPLEVEKLREVLERHLGPAQG